MPEHAPPPSDLSGLSLAEIARMAAERRLPPVERWNPDRCGDSLMRIARDGRWYHDGGPIERPAMVRLFASLLRREPDGRYVLVTPVEKLDIAVEDAPFVAVEVKSEGTGPARRLGFRLNTDEVVMAGPDHPLRLDAPLPALIVRGGLEARIARPVYYELIDLVLAEAADGSGAGAFAAGGPPGLWSDGAFFAAAAA